MDKPQHPPPPYSATPQFAYATAPQYGFQPPPGSCSPPTQVVVVTTLGPQSTTTVCPSCHAQILTRVEKEPNSKTHIMAIVLCLIFCPLGVLPYCTDSCLASNHYCPSCGCYIGSFSQ